METALLGEVYDAFLSVENPAGVQIRNVQLVNAPNGLTLEQDLNPEDVVTFSLDDQSLARGITIDERMTADSTAQPSSPQ